MTQTVLENAPDLRTGFPRSPGALVGPFVLLGRIIDKCRAVIAGTNGDYNFDCPLDRRFFDFFNVDADAFKAQVAQGQSDEALLAWVMANGVTQNEQEILAWCYTERFREPEEPAKQAYFEALRREVAPDRPYLRSWFELLDTEEGRL
jgi:hypothetical protein